MGFLGKLFGGSPDKKQPKSAREALPSAVEALNDWLAVKASSAQLCCVYSSGEDANRELRKDGRCRGWHFDFHHPQSQSFYLVRVLDGKAKGWERTATSDPIEYIYTLYGAIDRGKWQTPPVVLGDDWVDSTDAATVAFSALEREMADVDPGILGDYFLLSVFLPASYTRYLNPDWEPKLLQQPAPEDLCYAAIVAHIDVDTHDALIVYVNAKTGQETAAERFRFPPYTSMGSNADW